MCHSSDVIAPAIIFPSWLKPDPSIPVLDVRVSASTADEDSSGGMTLGSSGLDLVVETTTQTVGIRFNGITIQQDATITNTNIEAHVNKVSFGKSAITIQGQVVDYALTFSGASREISNRTKASISVSWNPNPCTSMDTAGAAYRPDPEFRLIDSADRQSTKLG